MTAAVKMSFRQLLVKQLLKRVTVRMSGAFAFGIRKANATVAKTVVLNIGS